MYRLVISAKSLIICLPVLAGCVGMGTSQIRFPQNPDEFVASYNWGGFFQDVERVTLDRPPRTVVANVRQFGKKCLDITVYQKRAGRYTLDKYGSRPSEEPVTYNTKVGRLKNGSFAFSVQESGNMKQKGLPRGGMFTLVAEIRSVGENKTKANIYHLSKSFIADPLLQWMAGDKRNCPGL